MVQWGASPRGTLALDRCARARAWLAGRDYVTPADVHAIAPDVLRHRVILTYQAESEGVTTDDFVKALVAAVPVP
jgi:MoxR-like ATPase